MAYLVAPSTPQLEYIVNEVRSLLILSDPVTDDTITFGVELISEQTLL